MMLYCMCDKPSCLDVPEVDVGGGEGVDYAHHGVHRHGADRLAVLAHHLRRQAGVYRLDKRIPEQQRTPTTESVGRLGE